MERRILVWVSACLISGIYYAEYLSFLRLPGLLAALVLMGILIAAVRAGRMQWRFLLLPAAFLAGLLFWQMETARFDDLDICTGKMVELQGTVYGLEGLGDSLRMTSPVLRVDGRSVRLQRDIRLRFRNEGTVPAGMNGRQIVLRTLWQPAESPANPRGFDYGQYLNRSGYQTELRIAPWQIVGSTPNGWDLRAVLYGFRAWYGSALLSVVPIEEGSVAYGMAIGDTVLIPDELMNSYRVSGLGHLLSVSGLHFAILFDWLRRILGRVPMRETRKTAIIIGVLTFMGFLNGWTAPALRAWGMIMLLILSRRCFRRYDGLTALSAIAVLTAVVQPLSVLQPGFQFSYGSVLGLLTLTRPLEAYIPIRNAHLREYLAASIAVQGAVVPLGIFWFGFWNPLSLLVNFPVMILSEWLMPVLVLFPALLVLGRAGEWLAGRAIGILVWGMNACSSFMVEQAQDWLLPSPDVGRVLAILLVILIAARMMVPVVGGQQMRLRTNRAALAAVVLLMGVPLNWIQGGQITFFSVGQGDGALIRFENQSILIDTGPASAKLDRLLLRNGISSIGSLVITHGHEDHIGGAAAVLKHLKVGRLIIGTEEPDNPQYVEMIRTARLRRVPVQLVRQGDVLYADGARTVTVLYPFKNSAQEDPNAHSLTLIYQEGAYRTLFTGDLVKAGEAALLARGLLPDVDLLKVPHHGSLTSSSQEWLDRIRPETAVISAGPNLYGLPNRVIIEAYEKSGADLYRTDSDGAVRVTLSGNRKTLKTWR